MNHSVIVQDYDVFIKDKKVSSCGLQIASWRSGGRYHQSRRLNGDKLCQK